MLSIIKKKICEIVDSPLSPIPDELRIGPAVYKPGERFKNWCGAESKRLDSNVCFEFQGKLICIPQSRLSEARKVLEKRFRR
jgi:hypothetical protein